MMKVVPRFSLYLYATGIIISTQNHTAAIFCCWACGISVWLCSYDSTAERNDSLLGKDLVSFTFAVPYLGFFLLIYYERSRVMWIISLFSIFALQADTVANFTIGRCFDETLKKVLEIQVRNREIIVDCRLPEFTDSCNRITECQKYSKLFSCWTHFSK